VKVLVTGATGFVGQALTETLLETPGISAIRALVRDPRSPGARALAELPGAAGRVELAKGDILDPTSLDRALDDASVDTVIHLVGIISEKRSAGITFERIHTLGTRNMVDAAVRGGVDRFIHMSALGTGPDSEARYHKSKWAAEEYVRQSGLQATILRPSIIFGGDDLFINRFAAFVKLKLGTPLPNYGRTKFQPIAVDDVAKAFALAAVRPESAGKTYDLAGPSVVTLAEIVATVERALGTWAPKIPLPLWLVAIKARMLQYAPYPFDLNPDQVTMMKRDNVGDNRPLIADFGLSLMPFEPGIKAYLNPDSLTEADYRALGVQPPPPKPKPEPKPEPAKPLAPKPAPKVEPKPEPKPEIKTTEAPKAAPKAEATATVPKPAATPALVAAKVAPPAPAPAPAKPVAAPPVVAEEEDDDEVEAQVEASRPRGQSSAPSKNIPAKKGGTRRGKKK